MTSAVRHPSHLQARLALVAWLGLTSCLGAHADTVAARCEVQARMPTAASGSNPSSTRLGPVQVMHCLWSQRQGVVSLARADGVQQTFLPVKAAPPQAPAAHPKQAVGMSATHTDDGGRPVRRRDAPEGPTWDTPDERIRVRWALGQLPSAPSSDAEASAAAAQTLLNEPAEAVAPVDSRMCWSGRCMRLSSPNHLQGNTLRLAPLNWSTPAEALERSVPGVVVGVDMGDLDRDGHPEVYVQVDTPARQRLLLAFASNRGRSLSDIAVPELPAAMALVHRGHDRYAVVEGVLVQRFPRYAPGAGEADAPVGVRQLQYRLERGEAIWRLRLSRIIDF